MRALDTGRTPPTHGHATPIPEISGFPVVTGEALRAPLRTAQVNAFGFGGVNAVAVLDREPNGRPRGVAALGARRGGDRRWASSFPASRRYRN